MLALYPSNKLEHLSYLLSALLNEQPGSVFSTPPILVESPGMQHWLSMQLAQSHGIAMNLQFPLPVRFMWDTARNILGKDQVPKQSAYRREVLVWRIDEILLSDQFCQHQDAKPVCEYWQKQADETEQSALRLQFATAIADVFEQYLLYRPDWLATWENRQFCLDGIQDEKWQALIWQQLTDQEPLHPAGLHQLTLASLKKDTSAQLPPHVIVFAINTMAPQLVTFLDALARHTTVHIFHLNPSINYWGEGVSDRQLAKKLREQGMKAFANEEQANPLLNNLGKQGRDLFNLLLPLQTFEVSAFDAEENVSSLPQSRSLLWTIQQDVLHASSPEKLATFKPEDNSVIISSAHSALREIQVLHDQLLTLMQNDPSIRPSDIVVMCPAVEQYAPLVSTVFSAVGKPSNDELSLTRLPCSIADRAPLDAEPLIAAFLELLHLPDSRFGVNQIMSYLRLESVQVKFGITSESLEKITHWLRKTHIHWGLDAEQKSAVIAHDNATEVYSWEWGLKRLLTGLLAEDSPIIVDELLTVPDVEGQSGLVLGQLIQIINQLHLYAKELKVHRSPSQWSTFLIKLRDHCFAPLPTHEYAWEQINQAASAIEEHCQDAHYTQELNLSQVRELLIKRFSRPDTGSQFHTGQVTFCSMLPMRSIPFKVVCILGLNDGEFPRQSQPMSVDLMAKAPARLGDRSRRQEDRYLFLEAILSARSHLYLSYQGRHAQDNSERQPSLVLAEFLALINNGYLEKGNEFPVKQHALHAYSIANFIDKPTAFDRGWMRLAQQLQLSANKVNPEFPPLAIEPKLDMSATQMARCLSHPLKFFANNKLSVYLESDSMLLDDAEPFTTDALTRYQSVQEMGEALREQRDVSAIERIIELSGELPATPLARVVMDNWKSAAEMLFDAVCRSEGEQKTIVTELDGARLSATVWEEESRLVLYHYGSQTTQRLVEQILTTRLFNLNNVQKSMEVYALKWSDGKASVYKSVIDPVEADQASVLIHSALTMIQCASCKPYPCFAGLAHELLKKLPQDQRLSEWCDSIEGTVHLANQLNGQGTISGLNQDPYVRLFYPAGLASEELPLTDMQTLYSAMPLDIKSKKV